MVFFLPAGVHKDKRLTIVLTQLDLAVQPDESGNQMTAEKVKGKALQFLSEKFPDIQISGDDVLPLSGLWAYNARMLMSHRDEPQYSMYKKSVEKCLSNCPSLPGGEGESQSSFLARHSDDELARVLLDASQLHTLETRYNNYIDCLHSKVDFI